MECGLVLRAEEIVLAGFPTGFESVAEGAPEIGVGDGEEQAEVVVAAEQADEEVRGLEVNVVGVSANPIDGGVGEELRFGGRFDATE